MNAFDRIFSYLLGLSTRLGYGQEQLERLASSVQLSSLARPAQALLSGISGGVSLLLLMSGGHFPGLRGREHARATRGNPRDPSAHRRRPDQLLQQSSKVLDRHHGVRLHRRGPRRNRPGDHRRPLFVTWGVLAFVTNYIPNIGFILGVIPPALIALLDGGVGSAVAVVVAYTVINVVVQTIIQPRFTGDAVGISATVAFVSLIFWAYVLGTLGALLAVPATLFLKSVLLDNSVPASWVNALVSASPSKEKPRAVRRTGRQPAEGSS